METLANCPICSTSEYKLSKQVVDHSISKEAFCLSECKSCGFLFTNPRPSEPESNRYYDSEDYISHSNTNKGIINLLYKTVRSRALKGKGKLVSEHCSSGKLLDYGCGTGEFLAHMNSRGFRVSGVEPSLKAREQAIMNHSLPIVSNINDLPPQEQFSVATMWHVLEHVHELRKTLKWLFASLKPEGILIVAVPNIESYDARKYGAMWAALDVPRHIYHFRERDIVTLFNQHGFEHLSSRAMWFDAFYISMLSERYSRAGSLRSLLFGFIFGALSNIAALTTKNTSSKIYVLKKSSF